MARIGLFLVLRGADGNLSWLGRFVNGLRGSSSHQLPINRQLCDGFARAPGALAQPAQMPSLYNINHPSDLVRPDNANLREAVTGVHAAGQLQNRTTHQEIDDETRPGVDTLPCEQVWTADP